MAPYPSAASASPQERQHSRSPEPFVPSSGRNGAGPSNRGGYNNDAGPSKKPKLTQSDLQRMQLEKLLANPEKEVALPEPVREKTLRDPHEMMKNVQGSAAGAGSGEFHVYKASRRREFERLQLMEDKGRALEEQQAFLARQEERDAVAEAKTAKNRAKRQKRKGGKKDEKAPGGEAVKAGVKRKLAGGADGFSAPRAGEPGGAADESEDEAGGEVGAGAVGVGNLNIPIPSESGVIASGGENGARRVEEARVVIHDDD